MVVISTNSSKYVSDFSTNSSTNGSAGINLKNKTKKFNQIFIPQKADTTNGKKFLLIKSDNENKLKISKKKQSKLKKQFLSKLQTPKLAFVFRYNRIIIVRIRVAT